MGNNSYLWRLDRKAEFPQNKHGYSLIIDNIPFRVLIENIVPQLSIIILNQICSEINVNNSSS